MAPSLIFLAQRHSEVQYRQLQDQGESRIMSIRFRKAWTSSKKLFEAATNASEHLWIPTKFVIWQSTHDPVALLLNEPDALKRRERTRLWRESKISELTTAAYTSALTSSVVAGAFSWISIPNAPWTTRAVWYSSLAMALISITTSTQQSILLHRMGSHTEGLDRLQDLLRSRNAVAGVPAKPRPTQLYVWQIPVNLLNISIILFLIGLAIQISAMALARDSKTWTDEKKIMVAFAIAGIYAVAHYFWSIVYLYEQVSKT